MPNLKKIGVLILKISISLALLIFLFRQVDFNSVLEIIGKSDKLLVGLSFLLSFLGLFFCFLRWKMLLETAGINLPEKRLISAFSGGIFFNLFLPSTVGGDFVRTVDIGYHSKKNSLALATVFLDRLSGFAGIAIVAIIAFIFGASRIKDPKVFFVLLTLAVLLVLLVLIIFNDFVYSFCGRMFSGFFPANIRQSLANVFQEVRNFKRHKSVIAKNLFLSVVIQLLGPLTTYIIALAFHLKVSIVYFFLFMPVISVITFLPISIGGLGVRDYMTVLLFTSIGVSKHSAFAFSLLGFFFSVVYAGIGGLIYVLTLHHRRV